MIPILLLLLLCVQINVFRTPMRSYATNPIDACSIFIDRKVESIKQKRRLPPNLRGFKLRWTQTIKRDEEKGSISIYTPWYFKKEMGYGILFVIIMAVMFYLIQGHPWLSMTAFPGVIGATFTGKASGVWDTEGQTTWNEVGHPVAGDTVTTGAFDITCGSATACATLTISAGGSLNTTVSNWSLTTTNACNVSGTLTLNGSTVSCTGTGTATLHSIELLVGSTFTGGSGPHTFGSILFRSATSTLTSGVTTIDSHDGNPGNNAFNSIGGTMTHGSGTVQFTHAGTQTMYMSVAGNTYTFYNLTINNASCLLKYASGSGPTVVVSNNLTITLGQYDTSEVTTGTSRNLTVTAATSITGTLTPNTSTVTFNGAVTVNNGGVLGGNTAWTCAFGAINVTFANGSTFNAPSATGSWTYGGTGSTGIDWTAGYTFNNDGGTLTASGASWLVKTGTGVTFCNVTITHAGAALLNTATSANITGTLTYTATAWVSYTAPAGGTTTLTMGTVSAAGAIVLTAAPGVAGSIGETVTIQAASATYPCVVTGTDWNWDATASTINLKWLDYQIDATTGGGGVTVNFTGNMTIDAWTVTAGDTLSCTVAGTTITVGSGKAVTTNGILTLTGTAGNVVTITGGGGTLGGLLVINHTTSALNYVTLTVSAGSYALRLGVSPTAVYDNVTCTGNGAAGLYMISSATICTFTNSVFSNAGGETGWYQQSITVGTGANVQLSSCTFATVGMSATSGWLVSKDHAGVANDYRFYGVANVNAPDASYRIGASSNVSIKQADAYSTSFTTTLTINVAASYNNITMYSGTALTVNSGIQLTPNNGGSYNYANYILGNSGFPTVTLNGADPVPFGIIQSCTIAGTFNPNKIRFENCRAEYTISTASQKAQVRKAMIFKSTVFEAEI